MLDLSQLNGSWEGRIPEPFPIPMTLIIDAQTDGDPAVFAVSFVAEAFNQYYQPFCYAVEGESVKLYVDGAGPNGAAYLLRFGPGRELECEMSQWGFTVRTVMKKVADAAVIGKPHTKLQENLTALLADNADFDRADGVPAEFGYDMDDARLGELREKYGLDGVAGDGDTESRAVKLLGWVCAHARHYGMYDNHVPMNSLDLLDYAFDQAPQNCLNCFNLSIILTECCLALGIKARNLWLMPANAHDVDCHVVTIAHIPEKRRWIMLDPTSNTYLTDADGNILSPGEIRRTLAARGELRANPESRNADDVMSYLNYLAKNMFRFHSVQTTRFGVFAERREDNPFIHLCPAGVDLNEWEIAALRYRSQMVDHLSEDALREEEETLRGKKNIYTPSESFWGREILGDGHGLPLSASPTFPL